LIGICGEVLTTIGLLSGWERLLSVSSTSMNFSASIGVSLSSGDKVLSHFREPGPAVLTIDQGDECGHDQTPLSIKQNLARL
jgi:hypothetical protein